MTDPVERRRALQAERHADLEARVRRLLAPLRGDERALDVGCGTGALAYVLAPLVGEVVGVDASEELPRRRARAAPRRAARSSTGDAEALPFPYGDFDLVGCLRVLHHVEPPGARRVRDRARHASGRPDPARRPARRRRPDAEPRARPLRARARPVAHAPPARRGHPRGTSMRTTSS